MKIIIAWLHGAREFRRAFTVRRDTFDEQLAYDRGREFMHRLTRRRYEDFKIL